jgi:hypothetical protein
MIAVLLNLLWGVVVTLSFAALGRLLARGIWPKRCDDFFLTAGWGMAGMVILGGMLNLFGVARSSSLVVLVIALVVLEALLSWRIVRRRSTDDHSSTAVAACEPKERLAALWVVCVGLLAAFKYASSLTVDFSKPDDLPAYLFQLVRLLQTGSIGSDPFSDRQLLSLNGQIFLIALVCSVCPVKYAFVADPGICWILIGGLTWSIIRYDLRGTIRDASLFTSLVYLVDVPYLNLSGYLTGGVLYLTLIRTSYLGIGEQGKLCRGALFVLALIIAALCALKTTYVGYAGLYMVAWFALRTSRTPIIALMWELFLVGIITVGLLLSWMYQQYLSGGTFFYPFLGNGFHISGPGFEAFRDSLTVRAKATIYYLASGHAIPALLGLILLVCNPFPEDRDRWRVLLASLLSASVGSLVIAFYMATNALVRYTLAFLYVALIPVGLFGFFTPRLSHSRVALTFCLVGFVGLHWENIHTTAAELVEFVKTPGPGRPYNDEDLAQIHRAQASIPPGKRILAWVHRGFLFDFTRNPIWNLDQGMTSPPPGLPVSSDRAAIRRFLAQQTRDFPPSCPADEMISYLRQTGIDFVVFERGEGTIWAEIPANIPPKPYWNRMIHSFARLISEALMTLRSQCKSVYDDGDMFVLDVSSAGRAAVPPRLDSARYRAGASVTSESTH